MLGEGDVEVHDVELGRVGGARGEEALGQDVLELDDLAVGDGLAGLALELVGVVLLLGPRVLARVLEQALRLVLVQRLNTGGGVWGEGGGGGRARVGARGGDGGGTAVNA